MTGVGCGSATRSTRPLEGDIQVATYGRCRTCRSSQETEPQMPRTPPGGREGKHTAQCSSHVSLIIAHHAPLIIIIAQLVLLIIAQQVVWCAIIRGVKMKFAALNKEPSESSGHSAAPGRRSRPTKEAQVRLTRRRARLVLNTTKFV